MHEDLRLESRVAKIESHVAHLDSTIAAFQLEALRKEIADEFKEPIRGMRTDLRVFLAAFSLLLFAAAGVAALIFKG